MALEVTAVFAARVHSKFTPRTIATILDAKRSGATATEAARLAGISRKVLYEWLARAKDDKTGIFATFADSYRRAENDGRNFKLNALIDSMAPPDASAEVEKWRELPEVGTPVAV